MPCGSNEGFRFSQREIRERKEAAEIERKTKAEEAEKNGCCPTCGQKMPEKK